MKFSLLILVLWIWGASVSAAERVEVVVEGLEGGELRNVKAALALPAGVVRDGTVDRELLDLFRERAPEKVRRALEPFGYYEAEGKATLEKTEDGRDLLRVEVSRGEPVRVAVVKLALQGPGAGEGGLKDLVQRFPLRRGDILNQVRYEREKGNLKAKALDLGYLDADFSAHVIRLTLSERRAELELILDTGRQYYFGEVIWKGAEHYPRPFLQRYLAFKPGDAFSYSKVSQTQLNLMNSDRFKEVRIVAEKEESRGQEVPLEVNLTPSPSRRFRTGVGYGTDTGARLSLNYQDVDVFNRGHEWKNELSLAERRQALVSRYIIPSPANLDSYYSLRLGLQQEILTTYDSRLITFEGERAHGFGKGRIGSVYLQFRQEDFSVGADSGNSRLIMPGLRFSQRRYDNLIRPTRGFYYALETRGTHQLVGSDTGFIQQLAQGNLLLPLPARFSLFTRVEGGLTMQNDPLRNLPATIRFFAGGDRSIRGYTYQSLGPKDSTGKVAGGRNLIVGSLELERALGRNWGIAAFADAGNAFDSFDDIRLFLGVGLGVRYYSPLGPVQVDVAYPVNTQDPQLRLHIMVGFQF